MRYRVIATGEDNVSRIVYQTDDRENCSAMAESYWMKNACIRVIAVGDFGRHTRILTDRDGREYEWKRVA